LCDIAPVKNGIAERSLDIDLAGTLKRETANLHAQAERAGVIRALILGEITRKQYCLLLRNLFVIYDALETGLSRLHDHRCLTPFEFPALYRLASLSGDLIYLHGPDWHEQLALCPAAAAYGRRLDLAQQSGAERLLAHAYVRYLGDLSGGQMLKRLVGRSLSLDPGKGVSFYDFGTPAEVAVRLQRFKSALGELKLTEQQQRLIIEEAKWAFAAHISMANQLMAVPSCTNP